MSQAKTPKKTFCLGRYLIDLPSDAKLKASFTYASGKIETLVNVLQADFERLVSDRVQVLKKSSHEKSGNLFVARTEISDGQIFVQSWDGPVSTKIHKNELFVYVKDKRALFTQTDTSSASAQLNTVEIAKRISRQFRHREVNEVVLSNGFCINSGYLESNAPNREEFSANINFKQFSSVSVSIQSYVTGTPSTGLIGRANDAISSMSGSAAASMAVLRKTSRDIGSVKGEEVSVRGSDGSKRSYEFSWKTEGIANSIEFPATAIKLTTTDIKFNGEIVDAPFKTDKDALDFWDDLINTWRLRPGAV